jgi:hypothetical protein
MEKEFTPYDRALKLKELGFNESCFGFYSKIYGLVIGRTTGNGALYENAGECLAPTFSQAFRFFREVHDLHYIYPTKYSETRWWGNGNITKVCDSYEEAELACLDKMIEIVETKNKLKIN